MFPKLFSKGKIGSMECKNRVIMAPMCTNYATPWGEVSPVHFDYYRERARGGVGVLIVENSNVDYPLGANGATQLRIDEDRFIPEMARLAESIREAGPGCRVVLQINHGGATAKTAKLGGLQPAGPCDFPISTVAEKPRALSGDEIKKIAVKFGEAALRAKKAGYDGIEVHGGYAYLLGEFISPFTNKRTDEYGGSVENRMRFPVMVVEEIRKRVGPGYPLLFRMNGDEFMEGALTLEMAKEGARMLEKASVDLLHVTAGNAVTVSRHIESMSYEEGWKAYLAAEIKKCVNIPVAAVGAIRTPEKAEEILESGVDFVALGRTLLADPYWVNKAKTGKEPIRRCISCLACASRRIFEDLPVRCSVNPLVGHEEELRMSCNSGEPGKQAKKVVVIGGGPAGLEAALIAAQKGHKVTLLEKKKQLGGQAYLAMVPPHKNKIGWFLDYMTEEIKKAGVEIQLGVEAKRELIAKMAPDQVIVATGAVPFTRFTGHIPQAITAHYLLENKPAITGQRVVVIGGGLVGCESAEYLAEKGNKVAIVEMLDAVAQDMDPIGRGDLLGRLKKYGVDIYTGFTVKSVDAHKVTGLIKEQGGTAEKALEADWVIGAIGSAADQKLALSLAEDYPDLLLAGDCVKPGRILAAVRQAKVAGESI